jgi:hypothetical protein
MNIKDDSIYRKMVSNVYIYHITSLSNDKFYEEWT